MVVAGFVEWVGGGVGVALGAGAGLPDGPEPCGREVVALPPPFATGVAPPGAVTEWAALPRDADVVPLAPGPLPVPGAGGPTAGRAGRWTTMTVTGCVVVVDAGGAGALATGVAGGVASLAASAATMPNIAAALSPLVMIRLASAA